MSEAFSGWGGGTVGMGTVQRPCRGAQKLVGTAPGLRSPCRPANLRRPDGLGKGNPVAIWH
jgi:hypothetical protein